MNTHSMARRFTHDPIKPEELAQLLDWSGLTLREFCRDTGADIRRAERWFSGAEPNPPLWTATFLLAMQSDEARGFVRDWVTEHVRDARRES